MNFFCITLNLHYLCEELLRNEAMYTYNNNSRFEPVKYAGSREIYCCN